MRLFGYRVVKVKDLEEIVQGIHRLKLELEVRKSIGVASRTREIGGHLGRSKPPNGGSVSI